MNGYVRSSVSAFVYLWQTEVQLTGGWEAERNNELVQEMKGTPETCSPFQQKKLDNTILFQGKCSHKPASEVLNIIIKI